MNFVFLYGWMVKIFWFLLNGGFEGLIDFKFCFMVSFYERLNICYNFFKRGFLIRVFYFLNVFVE